jgi:AraC-like DNA-binding protein
MFIRPGFKTVFLGADSTPPYESFLNLRLFPDRDLYMVGFTLMGITESRDTLNFSTHDKWTYVIDRHKTFYQDTLFAGIDQAPQDTLWLRPGDNLIRIMVASDKTGFTLWGHVQDSHLYPSGRQDGRLSHNGSGDCISFCMDPSLDRTEFLKVEDWFITLSPDTILTQFRVDTAYKFYLKHEIEGCQYRIRADSSGWDFSLFLPWRTLGIKPFQPFGFGVYPIDRDESDGLRHTDIWPARDRNTTMNPSEWGILLFKTRGLFNKKLVSIIILLAGMVLLFILVRYRAGTAQARGRIVLHPKVQKALVLLEQRFSDPVLTADSIARELNMNARYFLSLFKKGTGKTFSDALNRLRLENARNLLEKSERKVLDIAVSSGYDNLSTFNKNFKKAYGVSPSDFRKRMADGP